MKSSYNNGITAMELLVLIGGLALIVVIVLPQFSKIKENQVLKNGIEDTLSSINKARTQTLSSLNSSEYGVHFESSKVIIFKGTLYSAVAPDNEEIDITLPASITDVQLGAGSPSEGEVYFGRLSGNPSTSGTVTVSTTNFTKVITISATGVASVN